MRKTISLFLILLLITAALSAAPAHAASGFTVEDGVLVRYSGSSANVTVPDGVYGIGDSAFEGNTAVKTVALPSTVYNIGDRAFYNCSSLTKVTGSGVSTVGVFAFNGTPYFDDSTAEFFTLGSCLLWYNGSAKSVKLPSGIVGIAPYAFLRYSGMTSFSASSGLVSVGEGAFYECGSLAAVSLPSTVTYIGGDAFTGTAYLSKATGYVTLGDGVLIKYFGTATRASIPDKVRRIAAAAFRNNTAIKSAIIPSGVYSIDRSAFEGCTKLASLSLTSGLVYIGDSAFAGCTSLKELTTPDTLSYIGGKAFEGCTALDNVGLCGSKLTVSPYVFSGCTRMRYALLSDGTSVLSDHAFSGCTALEGISVPRSVGSVGSKSLSGCKKVTVCCTAGSAAASALSAHKMNTVIGDVDLDGSVSIFDATRIQRWLAEMAELTPVALCLSDTDGDACISVFDVTRIQRTLAGLA